MASASDKDQYDDLSDPSFDDPDTYGDASPALEDDDDWQDADAESAGPPPKKKAKLGNILIIGIGALLMLGVVYLQVFSGEVQPQSAAQTPQEPTQQDPVTAPPTPQAVTPDPQTQMPPQPTVTAPAAPSLGDVAVTPSGPDAGQPTDPFMPMPGDQQAASTVTPPQPDTVAPTPTQASPEIPLIAGAKTMPDVSPTPVEATPLQPTTPVSEPIETVVPGTTVATPAPVVDESRLVALEKKLTDIQDKLATTPVSTAVSGEDLKTIATQLEQISRRLAALEARQESSAVSKPTVSKSAEVNTQSQQVRSAPVARAPAVQYTFKAVAGNKAYVARVGSSTILSVAVGDSLAGMGTVQSISQVNGRWVIRTTMGRISQ